MYQTLYAIEKRQETIIDRTSDKDKDGVGDVVDLEPFTPYGVTVDSLGRSLDGDEDGVPDYRDICCSFGTNMARLVVSAGRVAWEKPR